MKNTSSYFFIIVLAFGIFIPAICFGQPPKIATDYGTCLQGVKDSTGKWIIAPMYENIDKDFCGYIVSDTGKYGVIDKKGRVLVPMQYDFVRAAYSSNWQNKYPHQYYCVTIGENYGIVDTTNRIIVPVLFQDTQAYDDTIFGARLGDNQWYFYHPDGSRFAAPWKEHYYPVRVARHCYSMNKHKLFRYKYGLCNDSGRVLLEQKYDYIEGGDYTNCVRVNKNHKYGFCSAAGQFIWPISFYRGKGSQYGTDINNVLKLSCGPAWIGNKCGMINMKGDTLLPFVYDYIDLFDGYPRTESGNLWVIKQGGLVGIYSETEGWKIPVVCAEIITAENYYTDTDSTQVGLLIYKKEEHWGSMTTNGQEVLPCIYDEVIITRHSEYVFSAGDSLMSLCIVSYRTEDRIIDDYKQRDTSGTETYYGAYPRISKIPDEKEFSVFEGKDRIRAFYHPEHTHDTIRSYWNPPLVIDKGNYYNFCVPDTIVLSCTFYTRPVTYAVISTNDVRGYKIDHMYRHSKWFTTPDVLFAPKNKSERLSAVDGDVWNGSTHYYYSETGDLITEKGKMILSGDSVYEIEPEHHGADGSLYFSSGHWPDGYTAFDTNGRRVAAYTNSEIGDFSDKFIWREGKDFREWQLLDIVTDEPVMDKKEYSLRATPIWDSLTIIEDIEHGSRLYNIKRKKYFTAEGYNRIRPLDVKGSLFALKTCSGRIGMMNANGLWVCDTIWTAFTPLNFITEFASVWSNDQGYSTLDFYTHYIFSNETRRELFDTKNVSFVPTDSCIAYLWEKSIRPFSGYNFDYTYTETDYYETDNAVSFHILNRKKEKYLPWQVQCIVDSMFTSRRPDEKHYENIGIGEDDYEGEYDYYFEDLASEEQTCLYCARKKFLYQAFVWTRPTSRHCSYLSSYVSDSVLSFSAIGTSTNSLSEVSRYYPSNTFLFSDGVHNMMIDSMFNPASDWRNFLVNTVLDYVNTHKNVEGDCHNPAGIPSLLQQQWVITRTGFTLFPPGFSVGGNQVAIPLNWKELDPYLRADLKAKLPIQLEN